VLEERIRQQQLNPRVKIEERDQIRAQRRRPQHRRCCPASASGDHGEPSEDEPPEDDGLIHADRLYSPKQVAQLEGCCLARVYHRLAAGEYSAFKDGRSTRIPGSSILARRAAMLTPATFKAPTPQPSRFHTIRKSEVLYQKNGDRK
jgi:hypothetical protein